MKVYLRIYILLIITLIGCKSDVNKHNSIDDSSLNKYFEFDEISHYRNEMPKSDIGNFLNNRSKSKIDSIKYDILFGDIPISLNDSTFTLKLKSLNAKENKIQRKYYKAIERIFSFKKHEETYGYGCIYVYRDILVFKKRKKITGVAKICFECLGSKIIGSKMNTSEFGMSGDYKRLEYILQENIK